MYEYVCHVFYAEQVVGHVPENRLERAVVTYDHV